MNPHDKKTGSRLFYFGTDIEVDIGDRVEMKSLFWRKKSGTVCYIPGLVEPHSEMENSTGKQWAIRADDGTIYAMGYFPELEKYGQPNRSLRFICRGPKDRKLMPNEVIDDTPLDAPQDAALTDPPTL